MDRAGNASDVTGTSVPEYVGRFANALGMPMEQDAEGIAALNAEELALARERMNLDQGPSNRQRQRMISAITDYYQSTLPKQADFSLLRRRG
jgi:carboxylesterase type B